MGWTETTASPANALLNVELLKSNINVMIIQGNKTIHIQYYALLREERGVKEETIKTTAQTPLELYTKLREQYGLSMSTNVLRVAINDTFQSWNVSLHDQDLIVFVPPVAGG